MSEVFFISGIDTDAGKSYATGWLAKNWIDEGKRVITQKFIQTGNLDISEDIVLHRKIMGCGLLPEDEKKITMPVIFSYPCSPKLAAELDNRKIDFAAIENSTKILSSKFDTVLLEGAGGLMVPLTEDMLTIDYILEKKYPLIFVTSGKLGSISQTLLSLEFVKSRGIELFALVYNEFPKADKIIATDTKKYFQAYLAKNFPNAKWFDLPEIRS